MKKKQNKKQKSKVLSSFVLGFILFSVILIMAVEWHLTNYDDVIAYWGLDSTSGTIAEDKTENNIDGVVVNGSDNDWVAGMLGNAFDFNQSQVIDLPAGLTNPDENFTINYWARYKDNTTTSRDINFADDIDLIIGKNTDFLFLSASGFLSFQNINLSMGWNMITLTYNGSNFSVYQNGTFKNSTNVDILSANVNNTIGAYDDHTNPGNVTLDDIGIWNRTLNYTDVINLWNDGNGNPYPSLANYSIISTIFNSSTYETSFERFSINISHNSTFWEDITVTLNYNNTLYSTTKVGTGDNITFSSPLISINLTNESVSRELYWNVSLDDPGGFSVSDNTENSTQTLSNISFSICDAAPIDIPYLNFTFKDEGNLSDLDDIIIPLSSWKYWIGDASVNKSYSFSNTTSNSKYAFCFTPNVTVNLDYSLQYKDFNGDYPQRTYNPSSTTYDNATDNVTLYLTQSADGLFVTFQVVNTAEQVLSDVEVVTTRNIGGTEVIIASGTTGADGTVTFWLNPDFTHEFTFSKSGFTTFETSFAPTQTSYTIKLVSGEVTNDNYFQGISYSLFPKGNLVNDTVYSFEFNLTSSFWDITEFGFNLRLANGTIVGTDTSTVVGTPATFSYNTTNQSIIHMDYHWLIDGNYTNASRYWIVYNSDNTDWSIAKFFTDLKTYLDSDLFGMDNFGRSFIIFLIMFATVGIVSYKFGLTSPMSITTLIFLVILFFEVVVDLVPPIRGIENLLTYITALALVIIIFWEAQR